MNKLTVSAQWAPWPRIDGPDELWVRMTIDKGRDPGKFEQVIGAFMDRVGGEE